MITEFSIGQFFGKLEFHLLSGIWQEKRIQKGEHMSEQKETLIVASKTKAYIKELGCMVSADALDELNKKVYEMIEDAVQRTKENKRSTLRSHDF